ncbi:branched-chain amino acid transaminase [Halalkalicoccus jeotgali]|uniref:Branched-chain-amino-acid aminotransferase n=1 Tax=Halalkalicoccus jeotgali (strain DSM 18796 / CECT 7217 / JCM 14584 / KCTC 4019 / B3) TaxID=795797 RepID=D8J5Y3_HALJB|nr:branched-chain amino acid transaminase [Halalkalicoccus jeotgali]ADJ13789.1 branched-chain amino acid aminotransferase [Halalkalicoccus jeotgali B3]ELY34165.1 branched-chain amino acid aminotransferase [Halalkalicoccus jeotgali B3]
MGFDEMDVDTIWMDGEFVDWDDAQIHVLSHGLHYGTGVFEGIRCYDTEEGPAIFRWDEHAKRLYDSGQPYGLEIDHDSEELEEATKELIRRQELESCYIRPIAFYGYDSLGVSPQDCPTRIAIAAWPWGAYLGEEALEEGVKVKVSSWRKHASSQIPTNAKTTGLYVNSLLAGEEARREGYVEALVLNKEGNVAEGPGENLFLVRDGEIYTPGLSEGILDGITRNSVITIARDLGYTVHDEATISRGELHTADELFFTGTAAEVTPIKQVDNVTVGERGPVTEELQSRFFDVVERRTDDYDEWFSYV